MKRNNLRGIASIIILILIISAMIAIVFLFAKTYREWKAKNTAEKNNIATPSATPNITPAPAAKSPSNTYPTSVLQKSTPMPTQQNSSLPTPTPTISIYHPPSATPEPDNTKNRDKDYFVGG